MQSHQSATTPRILTLDCAFVEASAKHRTNINEVFAEIVCDFSRQITKNNTNIKPFNDFFPKLLATLLSRKQK